MNLIVGILLAVLLLLGFGGATSESSGSSAPAPAGSIHVVARACPAGVNAAQASEDRCPIWPDGAAIQATDLNGNAWGMDASRDADQPGNPVVYTLDGLAFGTYRLGDPQLPPGFSSFLVIGAQTTSGGQATVNLTQANPHAEITVYFLRVG